jgi:hypothetical protein
MKINDNQIKQIALVGEFHSQTRSEEIIKKD